MSLSRTSLRVHADNRVETLGHTIYPFNATNRGVKWSTCDPEIATVSQYGAVTGRRAGEATITVTTDCGEKQAFATVTVLRFFNIGERGPAGGYVFYDNFKTRKHDGWRFLEMAPSSTEFEARAGWANMDINTQVGIGHGRRNTELIVAHIRLHNNNGRGLHATGRYRRVAWRADELVVTHDGTTFNDWFLPSRDELLAMYNLGRGGLRRNRYWSSSHTGRNSAWNVDFRDGRESQDRGVANTLHGRAIRAFF